MDARKALAEKRGAAEAAAREEEWAAVSLWEAALPAAFAPKMSMNTQAPVEAPAAADCEASTGRTQRAMSAQTAAWSDAASLGRVISGM